MVLMILQQIGKQNQNGSSSISSAYRESQVKLARSGLLCKPVQVARVEQAGIWLLILQIPGC